MKADGAATLRPVRSSGTVETRRLRKPRRWRNLLACQCDVAARVLAQLVEAVVGIDDPDGPRFGTHDYGLRVRSVAGVPHASQAVSVGDSRGAKEHVVTCYEV